MLQDQHKEPVVDRLDHGRPAHFAFKHRLFRPLWNVPMECPGQSAVNPPPPLYPLGLPVGEVSWHMNCPDLPGHPIEEFMHKSVRKAVFPVAGLGTRFLPATKAMPKEMLPIVDKPLIHYAVEEAKAAGIEQFFFVTSRAKSAIDDHFDRAF